MYKFAISIILAVLTIFCGTTGVKAEQMNRGDPSYASQMSDKPIDNHDGTVTFMNQTWSVIKGVGDGNVIIALVKSIGYSLYSPEEHPYYSSSSTSGTNDGYSDSLAKKKVDEWYYKNIKGTTYEESVAPVYLNNPTFFDMKKLGWKTHTDGNISMHSWQVHVVGPDDYPTTVDYSRGSKQAFILSGSDLAEKRHLWPPDHYNGKLLAAAIHYRDRLYNNGVLFSWLRSPSAEAHGAAGLFARDSLIRDYTVWENIAVVPALVVHLN